MKALQIHPHWRALASALVAIASAGYLVIASPDRTQAGVCAQPIEAKSAEGLIDTTTTAALALVPDRSSSSGCCGSR